MELYYMIVTFEDLSVSEMIRLYLHVSTCYLCLSLKGRLETSSFCSCNCVLVQRNLKNAGNQYKYM